MSGASPSRGSAPRSDERREPGSGCSSTTAAGVVSIAVFFVVMVVVFSLITDTFLTQANLLNILRQIAPLMIVAVAMTFVITTAGIDLSVGSVLALVNALAAISLQAGVPWPAVVVLMLALGDRRSAWSRASSSPTRASRPSS